MITITILSLTISIILLWKYVSDYNVFRNLSKPLGCESIKIIKIEDIVENDSIKLLSKQSDFFKLVTRAKWFREKSNPISYLQNELFLNRFYISYSELELLVEILEKEDLFIHK